MLPKQTTILRIVGSYKDYPCGGYGGSRLRPSGEANQGPGSDIIADAGDRYRMFTMSVGSNDHGDGKGRKSIGPASAYLVGPDR